MTARAKALNAAFLAVTVAAVGLEVWFANDGDPQTLPWTAMISRWIPEPITIGLIALLVTWIGPHFAAAYLSRRGQPVVHVAPGAPDPDPAAQPNPPREPLITIAGITMAAAAIVGCVVAFGVHLSETQQGAILTVVAAAAPIIVGVIARRSVYSPASVARIRAEAVANIARLKEN